MTTNLISRNNPEMNGFLERLEKALTKIDPAVGNESCGGFYLMKHIKGYRPTIELIGILNTKKVFRENLRSRIKDTLELLVATDNEPQNNNSNYDQRVVTLYQNKCTVISGHGATLNEAIAALWLIGERVIARYNNLTINFTTSQKLFSEIRIEADAIKREFLPDNHSLEQLAGLMENNY